MGEFRAVSHLTSRTRANITPFFDIPRPENESSNRLDDYLRNKAIAISRQWGTAGTLFIDYFDLKLSLRTSSSQHYVQFSFNELRNCGVQAIPVTGLDRDNDYNIAVDQTISIDKRGVAVRLQKEDIETPSSTKKRVRDLLTFLKVRDQDVHLLLDFRNVDRSELTQKVEDSIKFLINFGDLKLWKTIFLSASGFPQHMGGVQKYSTQMIPRIELELWEQVLAIGKKKNLDRLPAFSDYGICHPDILDFDLTMTPSANIRYTLERNWLIVKGSGLKRKIDGRMVYNYDQFFELAEALTSNKNYCGPSFSHGDSYIHNCSIRKDGPGSLQKWREAGTNHHLTFVAGQIANSRVI